MDPTASVMVNGRDAGGMLGKPMVLDVTRLLRPGHNAIEVATGIGLETVNLMLFEN